MSETERNSTNMVTEQNQQNGSSSNKKRKAEMSSDDTSLLEEARRLGRELAKRGLVSEGQAAMAEGVKSVELEENGRRADAALAAFMNKRGITADSDLFVPISRSEDCPICLVSLPANEEETAYMACCGRIICNACDCEHGHTNKKVNTERLAEGQPPVPYSCPFCRMEFDEANLKEYFIWLKKRVDANDPEALCQMAKEYIIGDGVEEDMSKAFDLTLRAVESGHVMAVHDLGCHFHNKGVCVKKNRSKYKACLEAAAKSGLYLAHYIIENREKAKGNYDISIKHYHIAASAGYERALRKIQDICREKNAFNGEYTQASNEFKRAKEDQWTEARDKYAEEETEDDSEEDDDSEEEENEEETSSAPQMSQLDVLSMTRSGRRYVGNS